MFHNVMMMGLSAPLSNINEVSNWENSPFARVLPELQQKSSKVTGITKGIKKKPKRTRTAFTTEQLNALEKTYGHGKYIDREVRRQLAATTKLDEKCIKVWFQNRRMKEKRDSESSCDSSVLERISTAASPTVKIEHSSNLGKDEAESTYCIMSAQLNNFNSESQYQLPCAHYYDNYAHVYGASNTMQPNTLFCYDTNVYPTQYYPYYYTNNYAQQNNWTSTVSDSEYYVESISNWKY